MSWVWKLMNCWQQIKQWAFSWEQGLLRMPRWEIGCRHIFICGGLEELLRAVVSGFCLSFHRALPSPHASLLIPKPRELGRRYSPASSPLWKAAMSFFISTLRMHFPSKEKWLSKQDNSITYSEYTLGKQTHGGSQALFCVHVSHPTLSFCHWLLTFDFQKKK